MQKLREKGILGNVIHSLRWAWWFGAQLTAEDLAPMIRVTFHLGPELHEAVSFQDHRKNIPGRGNSQHKGTEAGKSFLCSLKTSRGPVSKKSGRR